MGYKLKLVCTERIYGNLLSANSRQHKCPLHASTLPVEAPLYSDRKLLFPSTFTTRHSYDA